MTSAPPSHPPVAPEDDSVPPYVLQYAPLVWLYSKEEYLPSDLAAQLRHTHPCVNRVPLTGYPSPLTLDNLDSLNKLGGTEVYLTSNDDITTNPAWLNGVCPNEEGRTPGAVSACIIVNDKGNGHVDAFYLYFYAYNQGNVIFGKELGDHVGDWEHNMVRFEDGRPTAIWFSQHASGEAIAYHVVEKQGDRPLSYSAKGTHANYATQGKHSHVIPNWNWPIGLLEDLCDRGTLWDPTLGAYFYRFDAPAKVFTPYSSGFPPGEEGDGEAAPNRQAPTGWLRFLGHWGDQAYPLTDPRQHGKNIGDNLKYEGGPTGPADKRLDRTDVWPPDVPNVKEIMIWQTMPWA